MYTDYGEMESGCHWTPCCFNVSFVVAQIAPPRHSMFLEQCKPHGSTDSNKHHFEVKSVGLIGLDLDITGSISLQHLGSIAFPKTNEFPLVGRLKLQNWAASHTLLLIPCLCWHKMCNSRFAARPKSYPATYIAIHKWLSFAVHLLCCHHDRARSAEFRGGSFCHGVCEVICSRYSD